MAEKTKPSDFTNLPFSSVLRKTEAEMVARNIMIILERLGDKFQKLPEDVYIVERKKEGNFTARELPFFRQVIGFCKNPTKAKLFSKAWADELTATASN